MRFGSGERSMKQIVRRILRNIIKRTPLYGPLRNWREKRGQMREVAEWRRRGKPIPPPKTVKQRVLLDYATEYRLRVLVETGTFHGSMVEAVKSKFDRIYSIELSKELHEEAKERFRGNPAVELILGDSGEELGNVMARIDQPALFWLDAHYSGGATAKGEKDTPVYEELKQILGGKDRGHVIIIDDARCFGTDPAYPPIEDLMEFIKSTRRDLAISVEGDSIRITPGS